MALIGKTHNRRSDAKDAYDLMGDIASYVLEEPRRVWMCDWVIEDMDEIELEFGVKGPACGTVGCIAGNAIVLAGMLHVTRDIQDAALLLLGGRDRDLKADLYSFFLHTDVDAGYGTPEYAEIVAERIKKFRTEHEHALRGVPVGGAEKASI